MPYRRIGHLRRIGFSQLRWGEIGKPCTIRATVGSGLNISAHLSYFCLWGGDE
ncbi:MAG: hypothetical protein SNH35_08685 [Rikenellaceae bacterium]